MLPTLLPRTGALGRFPLLLPLLLIAGCAGGGRGAGSPSPPPPVPPAGPTAFSFQAGLAAVAPGAGAIRIDFTEPPVAGFEVAAFLSTDFNSLFSSPPLVPNPGQTHGTIGGLANGVDHFVGLGIRPVGGSTYTPAGPVLTARTGDPVFVDAASTAPLPDGTTPATAFPDLLRGMLTAFAGGRPVWVRAGTYEAANLPLGTGVSVLGGFGPAFDLDTRDPEATPTVFSVPLGQIGVQASDPFANRQVAVLDGVRFEGNGLGTVAVDVIDCSLEMRSVHVTRMRDRGIRARNAQGDRNFDLVLTHCESIGNGADGLSGAGAFDYFVHNSFFASNVQEGIDLNGLEPEIGGTATLQLTASRLFGNGAEGLDATLTLPLVPSSGAYSVRIRGCAFERNQAAGCLIDHDFEFDPGYSADILIEDSFSRANAGAGFHLDLDGPGAAQLSRILAYGNRTEGLLVTSESDRGLAVVSTSAFLGNLGAGLRSEGPFGLVGNRTIAVTHSLFSGNLGGGMISRDVTSCASSTIAYMQPSPYSGVAQFGCVDSSSPSAMGFMRAPEEYVRVNGRSQNTLTLATTPSFTTAHELELANDTVSRSASAIVGGLVTLTEAPDDLGLPGILAAFAPGVGGVQEDFRLLAGSIALGAGIAPPGGPTIDAGLFGSPIAAPPGFMSGGSTPLFYPVSTRPALSLPLAGDAEVAITFSAPLSGASASAGTVRVLRGGTAIPFSISTTEATLTLAPIAGWGAGPFRIELDPGLSSADGTGLTAPLALEFLR